MKSPLASLLLNPVVGVLVLALMVSSCDSSGGNEEEPEPMPSFDRAEMLANIGNNLIVPGYLAFQADVNTLHGAGEAFLADPSSMTLDEIRTALRDARLSWQRVAIYQFGPAENAALRGVLNTFPTDVDQINQNIDSGSYILGSVDNIDAGGFPALDYLLHGLSETDQGTLELYTTDPSAANRIAYLQSNLDFIKNNTDTVVDDWLAEGGNYIATFLSGEKGGVDVGSSLGQMVNAMILHYERFIRDGKIGIPAGVRSSGVPRPTTTESFYGGYSLELARESMRGLGELFEGTALDGSAGIGIRENLEALDASELAADISATYADVVTLLEGLSDPLSSQIESNVDDVVAAFTEMQLLVVLLKADMTSFLGVTITFQDNDGD